MTCQIPPNSPVVAYLRHSPGDKQTIFAQEATVREYCARYALIVVREYRDEAKSGTTTAGRDAFVEMIESITQGKITPKPKAVIVLDISRFGRNIVDSEFSKWFLRTCGCDVVSIMDDIPAGDMGPIFESLLHWSAQKQTKDIATKARDGLLWRARQGFPPGGFPPVGYTRGERVVIGTTKAGKPRFGVKWRIDPEVESRVRLAWQLKLAGIHNGEIHRQVRLTPTARGLTDFFSRKTYCGVVTCGEIEIADALPAYVSRGDWERVQQMIAPNRGRVQRGDNPNHPARRHKNLLSGIIRCGICGWAMVYSGGDAKSIIRCDWRHRAGAHVCKQHGIVAYVIHDAVIDWIAANVLTFETLARLRGEIEREFNGSKDDLLKQRDALKTDLETSKRKIARLVTSIEDGVSAPDVSERLRQRRREQAEIEIRLAEIDARASMQAITISDDALALLAKQVVENLRAGGESSRTVIRAIIQRADLFERRIRIVYAPEAVFDQFIRVERDGTREGVTWSVPPWGFVPYHTYTAEIEFALPLRSRYRSAALAV